MSQTCNCKINLDINFKKKSVRGLLARMKESKIFDIQTHPIMFKNSLGHLHTI